MYLSLQVWSNCIGSTSTDRHHSSWFCTCSSTTHRYVAVTTELTPAFPFSIGLAWSITRALLWFSLTLWVIIAVKLSFSFGLKSKRLWCVDWHFDLNVILHRSALKGEIFMYIQGFVQCKHKHLVYFWTKCIYKFLKARLLPLHIHQV